MHSRRNGGVATVYPDRVQQNPEVVAHLNQALIDDITRGSQEQWQRLLAYPFETAEAAEANESRTIANLLAAWDRLESEAEAERALNRPLLNSVAQSTQPEAAFMLSVMPVLQEELALLAQQRKSYEDEALLERDVVLKQAAENAALRDELKAVVDNLHESVAIMRQVEQSITIDDDILRPPVN
ncbi:uncharacterized protein L969DRAFT_91721 [Mixia osmundae IAM 14324]|uniref:Uncharacterized protein n=1 Tax=Mixia osmundae (strain CBS 9802 / IAM 14324 / JCM 22182 / KY 12970) TaxID=764103 RepID=G7E0B5_MIXOS|nr:uncharacterized protein L969DRAFT_91721 [Mixia osmundae IAM 14324]KEI42267.1 hypothetical protein L969DRAFT_91721 [Mixia osmundae IAM 14324]GAA96275.1 hypothetical protein E5Q_02941 [Mixia osmundae IAM 14324]